MAEHVFQESGQGAEPAETPSRAPGAGPRATSRRGTGRTVLAVLLLFCATAAIYFQVYDHRFINFDDTGYITDNAMVKGGLCWKGVRSALTSFACSNWHPLTWVGHMADYSLWGDWAGGHFLDNAVLHFLVAVLVFFFFRRHTGRFWPSFWVAMVFCLHPTHVESIAWASEKKDVLCALFVLATLLAYGEYVRKGTRRGWWGALLFFALALMAKPMAVTVPFLLLLLDFWPFRRGGEPGGPLRGWFRRIGEKVPFFLLSGISCWLTLVAQETAVVRGLSISFPAKLANVALAYWKYIGEMLVPVNLSFYYPFPEGPPLSVALAAAGALAAVTALLFRLRGSRPCLPVGWLWYVGMLVPVIGLVQVGAQSMADRYLYLPSIGLSVMAIWTLDSLAIDRRRTILAAWLGIAVCGAFAVGAFRQVGYWRDNESLYRRALDINPDNSEAWFDIALHYHRERIFDKAEQCYRNGLRIDADDPNGNYNLGVLLFQTNRLDESVRYLQTACRLNPNYAKARLLLKLVLATRSGPGPDKPNRQRP